MKRFLNKNTIRIFIAMVFVGLSFSFIKPLAKPLKLDYYKELFGKEFDFKIYESDKETAEKKDYLSSNPDKGYSIFLASSFEKKDVPEIEKKDDENIETDENTEELTLEDSEKNSDGFLNVSKAILICDTEFSAEYPFSFYCDKESFSSNEALNLEVFLRSYEDSEVDLYVIPENVLLHPEGRSDLMNYFKAIKRSDEAPNISEDAMVEEEKSSIISDIKSFKDTMVFEFFTLALSMFFIAVLSWSSLRFFTLKKRKFDFSLVKDFFGSLKNLSSYQKIIIFLLSLMFLSYIPMMVAVTTRDGYIFDFNYFISYTKDTFNLNSLKELSYNSSTFRFALFVYGFLFLELIFIFLFPLCIKIFARFYEKISFIKINRKFYKYSIPVLILISILVSAFIDISSSVRFLIFTLVLLSGIYTKLSFEKEFILFYSKKEKTILVLASLLILISGMFFRFIKKDGILDYKYEDLIGISDEVVLLPYSKSIGDNALISEYKFSGSEPIFADQYLIYSPVHSRIENKSASDFKNEGSFYIQNGDLKEIVKALNENLDFFGVMVSDSPSNFFRIKNPRLVSDEEVKIEITFSCLRQSMGLDKIKADFYYVDDDGEVEENDETLFYFPGCMRQGEPETFITKFDFPYSDSEYIYMRLVDVLPSDIELVRIVGEGLVIEPEYISKNKGYAIIDSGGLTTSAIVPITNYIFGDSYDLSFDLNLDEENKFDMSVPINELIKEGKLKDRFLIWSTKKYLPVRLPD